jgi:3-deoxy-D-manno-octulosonate 8-phosphate phosphatase (KDO 8-P phosphatase)
MTGEDSPIVQQRAKKLQIEHCYINVRDKLTQTKELCKTLGIKLSEVAAIGDDLNDIKLLTAVGFSAAPINAPGYIKREVDFVTTQPGGSGAFREFVEKILNENGVFDKILKEYMR